MTSKRDLNNSFWNQLEQKKITTKPEIEQYLTQKLGEPTTELQTNLLFELTKKITSYYTEEPQQSHITYSCLGTIQEIIEKKFKEGKRRGLTFYSLKVKVDGQPTKFRALEENLPKSKWTQVQKLALLGQNLVFKYKNWLLNKDVVDWQIPKK